VFTISLPLVRETTAAPPPETDEAPGGAETLLVVEDDEHERDLVEQVLLRQGYDVLTAADSAEAVDICRRHQHRISMLITDVILAQESGPQLYSRVAPLVPGIAVLFISGYTGESVLARGTRQEGVASLQKPFTPRALARRVREVLDEAKRQAPAG
jgi:DNA-binding NtrC family response regulator